MASVSPCPPHDWRRIYPRHITRQVQTDPTESVLFIVCCRCGRSPLYSGTREEWRDYYRSSAGAFPDWPEDKRITGYEWDQDDGPSVTFEVEESHDK